MSEVHYATVIFTGRVQGVGFRYQVMQIAKGFEVAGWVKNLADGRVQIEAEGRTDELRQFITTVQERLEGFIRQTEQTGATRAPQFTGFSIR